MRILIAALLLFITITINAQTIYSKAFGNPENKAVIFLHGGPGYNCATFEFTTAQQLADAGFYVITYDRRGEGRSVDTKAKYTFQETFDDLSSLYKQYNIKQATLIGHSFGGIVTTLYAKKHSKNVANIILVGAPVSLQNTFKTIIKTSKEIYTAKNDNVNLNYISMLENMDTTSIEYSSYSFMHAMQNGFYTPKEMSDEAKNIYTQFGTNEELKKFGSQMSYEAPQGFWQNENYTTIDLKPNLKLLLEKGFHIYGIYGKDDGLYSKEQVDELRKLLGEENLKYIDNCSHSVFIDQQSLFIEALKDWLK
jgi:proline iminopeptidase